MPQRSINTGFHWSSFGIAYIYALFKAMKYIYIYIYIYILVNYFKQRGFIWIHTNSTNHILSIKLKFKYLEWSSTTENTSFFLFMISSTKSSICKRLSSHPTPSFIGASFMSVLCIRHRVNKSSSLLVLLCLATMDKIPNTVGVGGSWCVPKTMEPPFIWHCLKWNFG